MPVSVEKVEEGLHFKASFAAGTLTLKFEALVDHKHRVKNSSETMSDANHGVLFSRSHQNVASQAALRYDFGDAVEGPRSLVLIGEKSPLNSFVYGQADGKELLPIRYAAPACGCHDSHEGAGMMVDLGGGEVAPVSIAFPGDYIENLQALIKVIEAEIAAERYSANNIALQAFASCFWATVACEVAAKACIVGCGATGPGVPLCIALCLAAEVACLLAVNESKESALAFYHAC
ncbi:hypothetical protein QTO30_05260 [Yoonia sp. GPGPB17]|uniref:hypothetical protein n=1 Tax=Yoonia sp. GPGPB17 TaxID=3026147 RepID=UPI0030C6413E